MRGSPFLAGYRGFERDARVFLVGTVFASGAIALFWINFNLYLASLGLDAETIGLIATAGALASAAIALPASVLSDRIGRRLAMVIGSSLAAVALAGLLFVSDSIPLILLLAVVYNVGQQVRLVVASPFMTEHSRPERRDQLFALQFALFSGTQVVAALAGGALAAAVAATGGLGADSPTAYRVLLIVMVVLTLGALVLAIWLRDDRQLVVGTAVLEASAEPGPARLVSGGIQARLDRLGVRVGDPGLFLRLILPGFVISLGAGQVLPFLNLYIVGRFNLDLTATNVVFAVTSFGTMVAILVQPLLAQRYGRIGSVVIVQAASIPFLVVLGFAPLVWLVVIAMAVRNSLMNASNPIYSAFVMDTVRPAERATIAATMTLLWSFGWAIGGTYYALVQGALGFERGYDVNFITIIVLYTTATSLYWRWFGRAERAQRADRDRNGHAPSAPAHYDDDATEAHR
jgi:MFS family permease